MTIRDHLVAAGARLVAAGIHPAEASLDAGLLARGVLGWDRATLLVRELEPPSLDFLDRFTAAIDRRARREPIAYIRGVQEFWGRDFIVSPAVLIPRPETELIVENTLQLPGLDKLPSLICDIGTGSGCLAISLAKELPQSRLVATDNSAAALEVARANAVRHGVAGRIAFAEGEYLAGAKGPFHVIVSNPPYVSDEDYATLAPEVHDHEPASALVAGADGLRDIREILNLAAEALMPGGVLLMEIGFDQADVIPLRVGGLPRLALMGIARDLQGLPRVAVVQRR
ncbi:MAG: peptide chain release factor N(5)-glutamine methyltransferase [Vicinamibacterales bacterium]